MKTRHIVHIIHSLKYGGIETGVIRLANEQIKEINDRVTIVCVGKSSAQDFFPVDERVTIKNLRFYDPLFIFRFTLFILKDFPDVLHMHLNLINMFLLIAVLPSKRRIRCVCSVYTTHNIFPPGLQWLRYVHQILMRRLCDVRVSDSTQGWRYCFGEGTLDHPLIIPVPLGVEFQARESTCDKEINVKRLRLGMVGRDDPVKNHQFALQILSAARERNLNWSLDIVGAGCFKELREKSITLGLHDQVNFFPPLKDLKKFYEGIDVFLLPSLAESASVSFLEAQVMAKNCVVSLATAEESIFDGANVRRITVLDGPNSWVDASIELSSSDADLPALQLSARPYGMETIADTWRSVYFG